MLNVKVAAAIIMMVIFVTSEGIQLDPLILSKKVQDLVENSLKRKELQDHLDSLSYDTHTVDGADLLNKMVDAFGRKFHERIATVKRLQRVVVSAYSGPPAPAAECCNLTGATYNARYAKEISLNKACVETSNKAEKDLVHLSTAFQDACIQNAKEVPSLRWQYFGSEDGALTIYPATILNSCNDSDFDIRFSPWYVKATVPNSKQVVIVIDKSSSMKKMHNGVTLMKIAIEAAKSVIAALNPRDEFAVLAFSTIAEQMQGLNNKYNCFATTLARATSQNKDKIYIQLDKVEAEGGTNYGTAIDSAFEFLETEFLSNDSDPSAYRVILFMSDGEPSDTRSSILFKLKNRNERLNNSTVILTYGLGDADFSILREMATYNGNPDKRGVFTSISDPSNLKHKMTSFYKYFASGDSGSLEPFWTFPYTDWIGSERMMTATLPVHVNNVLIGVVGVDLTISELLTESFYFKPNEFTYSFVIDGAGLIVTHPFFPKTSSYSSLFIPVTAVETDYDFLEVLESMKRGEAGNKTFLSTRIITFGDNTKVSKYGVREVQISSVYLWKRIPSTEFSVCVVYAVDDVQTELQTQNAVTSDGFTPLDLFHLVPPKNPCNHLNLLAVKDQAALALAPQTFKYPEKHFKHENVTKKDVDEIQQYLIDGKENAHDLKDGVRDAVVAVQKAQELWVKGGDSELQKQVVWRYVGLANGVTLIYPGNQAPSLYDPVARPWYQHAVANRNRNTISPPYLDLAIVETLVTTISRTLFDGRANNIHDAGTEVFGVMGVDLLLPYFHEIFLEMYPVCSNSTVECILLDMAGYIVLADQYVRDGVDAKNFKITHIAEKLPEITTILIESNVLKRINCSVTENSLVQRTYQIADNQSLFEGKFQNATDACIGFELIPVPTSNVFILVQFTNEPSCTESTPRYPRRCNCRNKIRIQMCDFMERHQQQMRVPVCC